MRALAAAAALLAGTAPAHAVRSAYLEVTELGADRVALRLSTTVPTPGLRVPLPAGCEAESPGDERTLRLASCPGGLEGRRLVVEGLGPLVSELAVQVSFSSGATSAHLLTASAPAWAIPARANRAALLGAYARLGLRHIFAGWDHLLFLAALAIALRQARAILIAETAFTAAHTLTFTGSALGLLHVSSAAAESCIALSLVFVALDASLAQQPEAPATPTARAAGLAFAFGLVHGLGFAGGLAELGLPEQSIAWALVGFAAGVEVGQLAFLLGFLGVLTALIRLSWARRLPLALAYAVGSAGAFLFLSRFTVPLGRS